MLQTLPTARSSGLDQMAVTLLQVLTKEHFDDIMRDWPNMLPKIQSIADERVKKTNKLVRTNSKKLLKTQNAVWRKAAPVDNFVTMVQVHKVARRWKSLIAKNNSVDDGLPGQVAGRGGNGGGGAAAAAVAAGGSGSRTSSGGGSSRGTKPAPQQRQPAPPLAGQPRDGFQGRPLASSSTSPQRSMAQDRPAAKLLERVAAVEAGIGRDIAALSARVEEKMARFEHVLQAALQQRAETESAAAVAAAAAAASAAVTAATEEAAAVAAAVAQIKAEEEEAATTAAATTAGAAAGASAAAAAVAPAAAVVAAEQGPTD